MICSKIHESTVGLFFFKILRIVKCTETKSLLCKILPQSFKVYCITILYKLQRVCLFIQHVIIVCIQVSYENVAISDLTKVTPLESL